MESFYVVTKGNSPKAFFMRFPFNRMRVPQWLYTECRLFRNVDEAKSIANEHNGQVYRIKLQKVK